MASSIFIDPAVSSGVTTLLPDGSVSAPALAFANDQTTGLYRIGASNVGFAAGGALIFDYNASRLALASGIALTMAGAAETITRAGIATTSTDALLATNTTGATSGVPVQYSPRLRLRGTAWDTSASETLDWFIENQPASAATPTSTLNFGHSLNGAAATAPMTLTSAGSLTVLGSLNSGSGANVNAGNAFSGIVARVTSGGGPNGGVSSCNQALKVSSGIADATPTPTWTITVPNAAHSACLRVTFVASLGAGGAIGANEATGTITYDFAIARTAGVATVVTASTAYGSATSSVAGAATITVTAAASAISGLASATQTFTLNVTITKGSGSSSNHTCRTWLEVINANASGVTAA